MDIYLPNSGLRLAFIGEAGHVVRRRLVFQSSRFDALELLRDRAACDLKSD